MSGALAAAAGAAVTAAVVVRSDAPAVALAHAGSAGPSQPAPSPAPSGFAAQFARPLAGLASAAPGEHILTIRVTPENLGPVTVQAHIGAEGVRVELFAPSDAGRAAVQAVLPELLRDLADSGFGATLDLSSRNAPQPQSGSGTFDGGPGARGQGPDGGGRGGARDSDERGGRSGRSARALRVDGAGPARAAPLVRSAPDTTLDILA